MWIYSLLDYNYRYFFSPIENFLLFNFLYAIHCLNIWQSKKESERYTSASGNSWGSFCSLISEVKMWLPLLLSLLVSTLFLFFFFFPFLIIDNNTVIWEGGVDYCLIMNKFCNLTGWNRRRRTKRSKENRDLRSWQRARLIT